MMVDAKIERLVAAAKAMIEASRFMDETYHETQELYNAVRAVTGEECEHNWVPRVAWQEQPEYGGKFHPAFTHCDKCGVTREP